MNAPLPSPKHNNPPSDAEILQERLQDNHIKLLDNTDALINAADRLPDSIEDGDEDMAGKISTYISQITRTTKALDASRVAEKEPFLTQGRIVDSFFKRPMDSLEVVKRKANRPLTEFLQRKADKERRERDEAARISREQAAAQLRAAQEAITAADQNKQLEAAAATEATAARLEKQADAKPAELAKVHSTTGATSSLRTRWVGTVDDRDAIDLEKLRQHFRAEDMQKALNSFVMAGGRELKGATIKEVSEAATR